MMNSEASISDQLKMPPPKPNKPPMVANLFDVVRGANVQLLPLFPYEGRGDIVPCAVARRTRAGDNQGKFWHENTVDEVMVCFGGNGVVRTGEVRIGPKTHSVGGGPAKAESFTVNCVTQRQTESGPQDEVMAMICENCAVPVFRYEFSGLPRDDDAHGAGVHALATTEGSAACVGIWNADPKVRTCAECGHVNEPFPVEFWGWDLHMLKTGVAQDAYRLLEEAGAQA